MAAYPLTFAEQLAEREMRVKEIHALVAVIECRSDGVNQTITLSRNTALSLIEKVVSIAEEIKS